jgi:hypothetical protein
MSDKLRQLLRQTDPTGVNADPADLADRVFDRSRRLTRRRQIGGVLAATFMVGIVSILTWRNDAIAPPIAQAPPSEAPVDPMKELKRLEQQIAASEQRIQRLLLAENLSRSIAMQETREAAENAPVERALEEMLVQADRLYATPGMKEPALRSYESIIVQFPQSAPAAVARQRARELQKEI